MNDGGEEEKIINVQDFIQIYKSQFGNSNVKQKNLHFSILRLALVAIGI